MLKEMLQDYLRVRELPWSRRYHIVLEELGESLQKNADKTRILMITLILKIVLGRLRNGQMR